MAGAVTRFPLSEMYSPGTPAYEGALYQDYADGLVSQDYYRTHSTAPLSIVGSPTVQQADEGGFFDFLGSAFNIAVSGYTKLQQMENEQTMLELDVERQRMLMARGMMGEGVTPSYGGLNMYTILMFAGVGLLAMVLLKKP